MKDGFVVARNKGRMPPVQTDYLVDESVPITARWSDTGSIALLFGAQEELTLKLSGTAAHRVICLLQAVSEGW